MSNETLYILTYYATYEYEGQRFRTVRSFTTREDAEDHANIVRQKSWKIESLREYRLVKEETYES